MADLPELTCNVCGEETAVGVASMPGVPASFAYGRRCLDANAHPYGIVVANTAMIGDLEHTADWWKEIVACTLRHLDVPVLQFNQDVAAAMADMERMESYDGGDQDGGEPGGADDGR